MYLIKWISDQDYLRRITNSEVIWGPLKYAKLFKDPKEAENYVLNQSKNFNQCIEDTKYWLRSNTKTIYIHPLNIE